MPKSVGTPSDQESGMLPTGNSDLGRERAGDTSCPEGELPERKEEFQGGGVGAAGPIAKRKWAPVADAKLPLGSSRKALVLRVVAMVLVVRSK